MTQTSATAYDGGTVGSTLVVGNGFTTTGVAYVEGNATSGVGTSGTARTSTMYYDLRGNLIATRSPQAPHSVSAYDVRRRATATAIYSATAGVDASVNPVSDAIERYRYDAYGRPESYSPADVTGSGGGGSGPDGKVTGADFTAFNTAYSSGLGPVSWITDVGSTGAVASPDNTVDVNDAAVYTTLYFAGTTGGIGLASGVGIDNRKGLAGYEFDPILAGSGKIDGDGVPLYHVRNRVLNSYSGKWIQKDPLGYHDSMDLYEYCRSDAVDLMDPTGLCGTCSMSTYSASQPGIARPPQSTPGMAPGRNTQPGGRWRDPALESRPSQRPARQLTPLREWQEEQQPWRPYLPQPLHPLLPTTVPTSPSPWPAWKPGVPLIPYVPQLVPVPPSADPALGPPDLTTNPNNPTSTCPWWYLHFLEQLRDLACNPQGLSMSCDKTMSCAEMRFAADRIYRCLALRLQIRTQCYNNDPHHDPEIANRYQSWRVCIVRMQLSYCFSNGFGPLPEYPAFPPDPGVPGPWNPLWLPR